MGWMTYTSLLDDLRRYLERGSTLAQDPIVYEQLPRIILQAQQRIGQDLKVQLQIEVLQGVLTADLAVYPKPDRWRETVSMILMPTAGQVTVINAARIAALNTPQGPAPTIQSVWTGNKMVAGNHPTTQRNRALLPRSLEYITSYWPDRTETSVPRFYADYDVSHWLISPTPDQAYPFEVSSYTLPQELTSQTQENWLTQYAPNLLLYACLLEATPFLKNDERIPVWQGMYAQAKAAMTGEDVEKIIDRSIQRSRA